MDAVDETDPYTLLQYKEFFGNLWDQIETNLKTRRPRNWERYLRILRAKMEYLPTKEIAEVEQVSRHRVSTLLQQARKAAKVAVA